MKSIRNRFLFLIIVLSVMLSCNQQSSGEGSGEDSDPKTTADSLSEDAEIIRNREAREDSLEMVRALEMQAQFEHKVVASVETKPVFSGMGEDAADDPAIWVNRRDPSKSRILGTNKTWGVNVYDLEGNELQAIGAGRVNNIDLRDGFNYMGKEMVLVAASNRTTNSVSLMVLDPVTGILSDTITNLSSTVDEVYGLCNYKGKDNHYVFVNGKGGLIEQWKISEGETIEGSIVRTFSVNSQPEGMVADDENHLLYVGVEQEGIYILDAGPEGETTMELLPGSTDKNSSIYYDIEGLALFSHDKKDYLIASSQGNFSYAIFELGADPRYLTSFVITDGQIDGVEETDGLDITVVSLSARFPEGLLVVQDGFNYDGEQILTQNFKLVSFEPIRRLLESL